MTIQNKEVISASAAKSRELTRYFTGKPCPKGHIGERFVSTRACIICALTKRKEWGIDNAEHVNQYWRDYNKKNKSANAQRRKQWRLKNLKTIREYERKLSTKRRADNPIKSREERRNRWARLAPEKKLEISREKRRKNPEGARVRLRNYKARKKNNGGHRSISDINEIFKLQRGKCAYCKCLFKETIYHVDHIIPLSAGGRNDKANLQLLCAKCNVRKSWKNPLEYARQLGMLL